MSITEKVFKTRDNPNKVEFKEDGTLFDFTAVTRMVLSFEGLSVVADTDVDSALIDWTQGAGLVEFNLNDLAVGATVPLNSTLVAYDPAHTGGQVIVCSENGDLKFQFIQC